MLSIRNLRNQFELQGHIVIKSFDDSGENEIEHYSDEAEMLYDLDDSEDEWIMDAEIQYMYPKYEYGSYGKSVYAMIVIEIKREEE